jgi:hypothetical protein
MPYIVKKNKFIFLLLCISAWCIAIVVPLVFPGRFFGDALTIINGVVEEGFSGSYEFATMFYRRTGLASVPFSVVAFVQFPILMYCLYKIGVPDDFHILTVKNVVTYLAILIMAVFISMPSKEFITFVYIAFIIYIFKSRKIPYYTSIVLSCLLLAFLGAFFRVYFLLMPIVAVGMFAVTFVKLKNKKFATFIYGMLIIIFLSFSYGLIKGEFLTESTRIFVNQHRPLTGEGSNSIITSPVDADTWYGEIFGILYGFFSVNLPINGFKHIFSPQIIAFIIWQLLLFWILFVRFSWALKDRYKYRYELWALILIFAYFIVQGVFEPDLGSAVKHKIGMFPLIYYALYYENSRQDVQQAV